MKKKIAVVVLAFSLLAMTLAAAPVMAIGPYNAFLVGNNPNIQGGIVAIKGVQMDASGNTMLWSGVTGVRFHDCEAGTGAGRMNNAIIADMIIVLDMVAHPENYVNKWVFLSGGPSGMLYEYALRTWGPGLAALIVAKHPDGMFITRS